MDATINIPTQVDNSMAIPLFTGTSRPRTRRLAQVADRSEIPPIAENLNTYHREMAQQHNSLLKEAGGHEAVASFLADQNQPYLPGMRSANDGTVEDDLTVNDSPEMIEGTH